VADQAPEIKVKITGEDTGVAAAIKELGNQLSGLKQKSQETGVSFEQLKGALEKIITAELIFKVVEFGKEVYNTTLNIERMSQRTGISASTLSVFAKAAESSGVSTEQVNTALTKVATNVTKFQQGATGAAAAFKTLNISQADFKNLSPDEKIRLVTDRLGGMASGFTKNATATALFGKGGAALIPVLNQLAGEGFDKVTEAAKRSGQFLTDEMAADAATAAAAFAELEGAGKGIATQFEAGLIPAITDVAIAFTDSVEGDGVGAFRELGEDVGLFIKALILGFEQVGDVIGAVFLSVLDVVHGALQQIANAELTVFQSADEALHGHFKAAGQALADGFHFGIEQAKQDLSDFSNRVPDAFALIGQQAAALFPSDERKKELRPKPTGDDRDKDAENQKLEKAKLSLREAEIQEQLALTKASNAAEENANQIAYNEGLESLKDFYRKKLALAESDNDAQIDALSRQRAVVASAPTDGTDAAAIAKKQKLEKLDNDIAVARITGAQKLGTINEQQFQAGEAHKKTLLGYEAEILTAQGRTYQAALAKIAGEAAAIQIALKQAGLSDADAAAKLAEIQSAKSAAAAFDDQKKQGELALQGLSNEREQINLKIQTGQLSQMQGEIQIAALENNRLPELQKLAAAMHDAAIKPEDVQKAEEFKQKLDQMAASADFMGQEFGKFKTSIEQGGISELSTFLGSTINQVHGVGDAFRQLAGSAVASLQKIAAQLLAEIVIRKLIQAITHQDDSPGTKIATAGAAGLAQAAPLIAASAAMGTAGGIVLGAGITLGASAAALQIAATTLLVANSIGGAAGLAGGGLIGGSGTGDTVPAMLTPGEFVVREPAVREVGVAALSALNRGFKIPGIAGVGVQRFAEGGLVSSASGSNDPTDIKIALELDPGLILRHMSSKAAGRIVLHHLTDNPKAASRAIQRGG
jgi:hypothetical protein